MQAWDNVPTLHKPDPDNCDHCAELALLDAIRDFAREAARYVLGGRT